jgi:hypothetical protein
MSKAPAYSSFIKKSILFLAGISALDILLGYIFLPFIDVHFSPVRVLHPYFNHGFNQLAEGVEVYGPLKPLYHINSLGMKDFKCREVPLKTTKHRILFIGDSFTEGIGYPYDSIFCGYLQSKVDSSKIEILNAGVASFSPKLYYLRLDYLINHQGLKIDEVYCLPDYSDVPDELFYQDFKPELPGFWNGLGYGIQKFYRNHSIAYYTYSTISIKQYLKTNNLDKRFEFLYWLKTGDNYNKETNHQFLNFKGKWIDDEMISLPVTQKAIALADSNLNNLFKLCEQHHIKIHLIVYPGSDQVNDSGAFDQLELRNKRYVDIWKDMAKKSNVDFIDLFPLFVSRDSGNSVANKASYYIQNDSHWNSAGHKRVADSLYSIITNKVSN